MDDIFLYSHRSLYIKGPRTRILLILEALKAITETRKAVDRGWRC
jgi:hypothetical protein